MHLLFIVEDCLMTILMALIRSPAVKLGIYGRAHPLFFSFPSTNPSDFLLYINTPCSPSTFSLAINLLTLHQSSYYIYLYILDTSSSLSIVKSIFVFIPSRYSSAQPETILSKGCLHEGPAGMLTTPYAALSDIEFNRVRHHRLQYHL